MSQKIETNLTVLETTPLPKIKIQRMSGGPVDPENGVKFQEEYKAFYDKVCVHLKIDMEKPQFMDQALANRMQKMLEKRAKALAKKYPVIEEVELINTEDKALALLHKYQVPVMLAQKRDNPQELIYVIADML